MRAVRAGKAVGKWNTGKLMFGYSCLLGVMLLFVGICLGGSCVRLYCAGPAAFSRAAVAAAFHAIRVPVYLCMGMVMVGWVLDVLGLEAVPPAVFRSRRAKARGGHIRTVKTAHPEAGRARRIRRILQYVLLLSAVGMILYGLLTGGSEGVIAKAAHICSECIGLG